MDISQHARERWVQRFSKLGEPIEDVLNRAQPATKRRRRQIRLQSPIAFNEEDSYLVARGKLKSMGANSRKHRNSHRYPDVVFVISHRTEVLVTVFSLLKGGVGHPGGSRST